MEQIITCPHCGQTAATIVGARVRTTDPISPVTDFVDRLCVVGSLATCTVAETYEAYKVWSEENGEVPMSKKRLSMELALIQGVTLTRASHGQRVYRGIRLR